MIPAPPVYKQTSHLLHLVLCCMTLGLWWPVWLTVALTNNSYNRRQQEWYQQCVWLAQQEEWRRRAALAAWQADQIRRAVEFIPRQDGRRALRS